MFKLNIEKAKDIHRNHLRYAREAKFKELDAQFMIALESNNNDKIEEIKTKKQELRDITKCDEVECATCIEDLKSHWPECLGCECPYHHP
jgi:ribosomal protein L7/L12